MKLIISKKNSYKNDIKKIYTFKIILIFLFLCTHISFSSGLLNINSISKKKLKEKNKGTNKLKLNFNNFTTYSQCLEDFILYCIFYDIEKGFYIDVGANDPNKISVTKAFYSIGWYGINIEPLPNIFLNLTKYRTRDINLNYAAGQKDDVLKFYAKGAGSTLNKKYSNNAENIIDIQVHPMSKICSKYVPKDKEIEFCKIDVEGYEKNVLLGYDFVNYRPKVFCIESTIPAKSTPIYSEWEYILKENGYQFGFQYIINRYYYDSTVDYLSKRFLKLSYYIKEYKKIQKKN